MKPSPRPVQAPGAIRTWPAAVGAAVIAGAAAAAYWTSFAGTFVFDDDTAILKNPSLRSLWRSLVPPPDLTTSGRPVANFTLAVNYAVSGLHPWSYHAFNLLVLIFSAWALFGIVRRTLQQPRLRERFGASATPLALVAALLWTLHPLQTEAVTYIVQRVESLMGLFYLLTFYGFIRSIDSPRPRRWQILAVAACLLGMGTKEVTSTAPVLLLFFDRAFAAGTFREAWRRRRGLYLAMAATWVPLAVLVASTGWNRGGTAGFDVGVNAGAYWLTQFEAVVRYLGLSVWPHPLIFDYKTFWVRHPVEIIPYAVVVVALAVATLWALWRRPVPGFLGGWFFAILAPTSVIPGTIQMIVEHRMYLPLAAVTVGAVCGAHRLVGRRCVIVFLALAAGLGWLTARRNEVYRSDLALWSDTIAKCPDSDRANNNLANALLKEGRVEAAIARYETALRLRPDYVEAHSNLGNALLKAGRVPEAIAQCRAALRLQPKYASAHNNLGNALLQAGRLPEAIQQYEEGLQIKPRDAKLHYNLGNALLKAGRLPEAIAQYEISLRWQPDDAETEYNLGNALYAAGRMAEAITHFAAAVRLQPSNADAHNNLGNALLQANRTAEAIAEFREALQVRPGYAEAYNNLGAALYQAGHIAEAEQAFAEALRLRPDYSDARRNLERMQALRSGAGTEPPPPPGG